MIRPDPIHPRRLALMLIMLGMVFGAGCAGEPPEPAVATDATTVQVMPGTDATGDAATLEPLPPRPAERAYPPVMMNPPHSQVDREPWMAIGETLAGGSTVPTRTRRIDAPPLQGVIPWHQAHLYIGQIATIEGTVVETGAATSGNIHFLNFVPNDRQAFAIPVFLEAFEALGGNPAQSLKGKTIQVTGLVSLHRSRPQIPVRDGDQIKIMDQPTITDVRDAVMTDDADEAVTTAQGPPVVKWDQADRMRGHTIVAEGKVLNTNNIGNVCFINFTEERGNEFYIVIFEDAYAGFPEAPEKHLLNKTIRVTGEVVDHRGRAQIQVRDAKQVQIVE